MKGDVYTYTPDEYHCVEGLAIENERGELIDWYWGGDIVSSRQYVFRNAKDLTLIANLGDYELTRQDGREGNEDYATTDRLTVHSQHGLQRTHYIRKGASPDLETRIANARARVEQAEDAARAAQRRVEWAREDLDKLIAEKEAGKETT